MRKIIILALFSAILNGNWNLYPTYPLYLKKHKKIISNFFFKAKTKQKIVALTFDDGPNIYTKKIVDTLIALNAPATFFLIAKNLKRRYVTLYNTPLFNIGMHSLSHKNFDKLNQTQIDYDFCATMQIFKKYNLSYKLFRPPYGVVNKKMVAVLKSYNIKAVLWSNDTKDWNKKLKNYKEVIKNLKCGDIILMHEQATTPKELKKLIVAIRAKGFKIVTLNKLLQYQSSFPVK